MPFTKTDCTNALINELAASSILEKEVGMNRIGRFCVVDVSKNAVLFPHLSHYSTLPDQSFTLIVDGLLFRVWEIVGVPSEGNRIEVFVSSETEHFTDSVLFSLVREAFSVLRGTAECTLPISVKNRSLPPKAPRPPEKIIESLNKFLQLMPPGSELLSQNLFVPALVRPEELEAFISYGRETAWKGLEPKAIDLFREVLVRLESEANQV